MGDLRRPRRTLWLLAAVAWGCAEPTRTPRPDDATSLDVAPDDVAADAPSPDASPATDTLPDAPADRAPEAASPDAVLDRAPPDAARDVPAEPPPDAAPDARAEDVAGDAVDASDADDVAAPADVPVPPVRVIITADNAYSFGFGTNAGIVTYVQGRRATVAGEIFNCPVGNGPEAYAIPSDEVPTTSHIYIVSWDDLSVTQGVIGQFSRGGRLLYTGDPAWRVCATGVDLSRSATGPTQAEVNAQIALCNAGTGAADATSQGWVDTAGPDTPGAVGTVAIGEPNDALGGTFPQVCPASMGGIDVAARWIWYQPGGVADPFRSTGRNTFRAYLIFRLAVSQIPL